MHKLALIGFGGVGQGFVNIIREKQEVLEKKHSSSFKVVSICDLYKGALHHPEGLDLEAVMDSIQKAGDLSEYPDQQGLIRGWSSKQTIEQSNADTIVEMTFTDINTGQPAIDHCTWAFERGKNAVLTNKGPVALAYHELAALAKQHGVRFLFEGAVMSGTPALRLPQTTLVGNEIEQIKGILNGTTNYMLERMEAGLTYEEALEEAQQLGYAEADPTADVEGFDVMYKVLILANVILGEKLLPKDVTRQGISSITTEDIKEARQQGYKWKLIGSITKTAGGVKAIVRPERLPLSDPLAGVSGAMNAITYTCDLSGPITLVGAGAGIKETGFAVLIDLLQLDRGHL